MKVKLKTQSIRQILARKNVSQNWLAQRLDTSSGYMSQLMAGTRNPSPHMREKILEVLKGHEFDDLFTLQGGVIALFPRHVQTGSGNRRCHVSRTSGREEWGWQEGAHLVK